MPTQPITLLDRAGVVGPGPTVPNLPAVKTIDVLLTGPAPVTATVNIEVCNTAGAWKVLASFALNTATPSDGALFDAPWASMRANVTSISAGAVVSATAGAVV